MNAEDTRSVFFQSYPLYHPPVLTGYYKVFFKCTFNVSDADQTSTVCQQSICAKYIFAQDWLWIFSHLMLLSYLNLYLGPKSSHQASCYWCISEKTEIKCSPPVQHLYFSVRMKGDFMSFDCKPHTLQRKNNSTRTEPCGIGFQWVWGEKHSYKWKEFSVKMFCSGQRADAWERD